MNCPTCNKPFGSPTIGRRTGIRMVTCSACATTVHLAGDEATTVHPRPMPIMLDPHPAPERPPQAARPMQRFTPPAPVVDRLKAASGDRPDADDYDYDF